MMIGDIAPRSLAEYREVMAAYNARADRIGPLVDKVIGQYRQGLITPDELAWKLADICGE